MKVHEMKDELEKMAKVVPELRHDLDAAYVSSGGKKSKIKLLWKQYEHRHKELKGLADYKNLNLQ